MESERSCSSSSSSGSGSESGSESGGGSSSGSGSASSSGNSSEAEEERLEPVALFGRSLSLPQRLCESRALFDEVVSARTWESLEDEDRERLRVLLPTFPEDDAAEKERTVRALFGRETFHFSSPLDTFHSNLKQGNYRPDIAKMKRFLVKARRRQQKHKMRSYYATLLPELLVARERLLAAARASPPGPPPRLPPRTATRARHHYKPTHARAKLRYFEELAAIRGEVGGEEQPSEDENYPEGPPQQSRRQRRHLTAMQNAASMGVASTLGGVDASRPSSLDCLKHVLAAHRARRNRRENHPELNTAGITLEDIKQRVALVNGAKKITFGGVKTETPSQKLKRSSKKENNSPKSAKAPVDIKPIIKMPKGKDFEMTEMHDMKTVSNVTIKTECMDTDSDHSSYIDPVESPKSNKRLKISPVKAEIKQEVVDIKYPHKTSSLLTKEAKFETRVKQEAVDSIPFSSPTSISHPIPIKLEDLEGIDMMDLPVELADCDVSEPPLKLSTSPVRGDSSHTDTALMETTHANFLSLVRALFPARSAHRASRQELHSRAAALMSSPIAPLNTWYSLSEDWCAELDSALEFLAGEKGPHPDDFVPYLTYIPETQLYQWIGAGRDCDAILGRLCERWLRARSASSPAPAPRTSPPPPPPSSRITEPQPPRSATTWTVRGPTGAELVEFHAQERRRYSSAARPFTYVQHGYRAVVGPAGRGPANRASHAALLVSDRPRHVSFVALVKDAVARLPNGEGTRAHILTLLKMSQYVGACGEAELASAVSGALDRLHAVKRDPYLRYDQRTKLWIYLHRHKSEEDWERSVRSRGSGGGSKSTARAAPAPAKDAPPPPRPAPPPPPSPPNGMDVDVEEEPPGADSSSDSDVDVDDSGPAPAAPPPTPPPLAAPHTNLLLHPPRPSSARSQLHQARPAPPTHKLLQQVRPPHHGRLQQQKLQQQKQQQTQQPKPQQQSAKPQPAKLQQQQTKQPPAKPQPQAKAQPLKTQQKTQQAKQHKTPPQTPVQRPSPVPQTTAPQGTVPKLTTAVPTVLPPRSSPLVQVSLPQKSPATKQRTFLQHTIDSVPHSVPLHVVTSPQLVPVSSPMLPQAAAPPPAPAPAAAVSAPAPSPTLVQTSVQLTTTQPKMSQATRSLLLKAPVTQVSLAGSVSGVLSPTLVTNAQVSVGGRRGVVRVLSPATPTSGKSLISPRALMHQGNQVTARRRAPIAQATVAATTSIQVSSGTGATLVSVAGSGVVSSVGTRTVQLAGGRTVQLSTNQTLHLPSGQAVQAVQLSSGHTLQLSSLGVGGRLPSAQTMQQLGQNVRTTTSVRPPISSHNITKGTIQLSGQNVQLAGLSGQMQLGHSVKLPSGQSVQLTGQTVQLPSGQSVQLGTQTVQLSSGQTVQTVQLSSGQTIQLANGQTVQLGQSVGAARSLSGAQQVVRPAATADKTCTQPLVAKLLTNSQGQVISMEGMVGAGRTLQLANLRPQGQKQLHTVQGVGGVRVVGVGGGARMSRPLLLTHKPLHNIILQNVLLCIVSCTSVVQQQGEGGTMRATSAGGATSNQTIVLSSIGGQTSGSTPTSSAPVLKLQQVSPLQQVKLAQSIKLQQGGSVGVGGVRGVVMDGQQLKLVGGAARHVLARVLRPAHPP